jgi:hypothetical protein
VNALVAAGVLLVLADLAGNLIRLPLFAAGGKSAPLIPLDLIVGAFVLIGLAIGYRRRQFPLDRVGGWGTLFLVVGSVSVGSAGWRLALESREIVFAAAYLVRWGLYFGIYACAAAYLPSAGAEELARLLRRGIVLFAAFGIVQALTLPGFAQLVYPESALYLDWDPQGRRLVSTFLDPNYAGILIVMGLCLWGGALLAADRAPAWEGLILGAALLLTFSRSALLAALAAFATLVLIRGVSARVLILVAGATLLTLSIVPWLLDYAGSLGKLSIDASAIQRLLAWQRAVKLIGEYPVLGIGFNTLGFVATRFGWTARGASGFGLDGGLLFITALTGFVGLFCFLGLLTSIVQSARRSWQHPSSSPLHRGLAFATAASVVAVTVHATFANTLLLSLVLAPCWLLWAMPRALRRGMAK